jgi:hypothetical protein
MAAQRRRQECETRLKNYFHERCCSDITPIVAVEFNTRQNVGTLINYPIDLPSLVCSPG